MKIGIFDSGVGGLSVLLEALEQIPEAEFIFYGDTKHVPYGEKTEEEIRGFVEEAVQFLISRKADAIVLACNTATSVAGDYLRAKYSIPIIGMEPAAKLALDTDGEKRILVIATPVTVRGNKLHNLLGKYDKHHLIDLKAMPGLVRFAENSCFDEDQVLPYIEKELENYSWENYSSIVLGCTHFNYFKDLLHKIVPDNVELLDGNEGTVRQLSRVLRRSAVTGGANATTESENVTAVHRVSDQFALDEVIRNRVTFYYSGAPVSQQEIDDRLCKLLKRLLVMQKL